jgi:IMP cyclohydrolase
MNFGQAIDALKEGKKVYREGWNGKGMYLYYVPANSYAAQTDIAKKEFGDTVPYLAYIAMKTVQDTVVPWLASQTDMLAEDWQIVE